MKLNLHNLGGLLLTAALTAALVASSAAREKERDKETVLTGTIGDALCGVEHSMPVSAVECIRQCVGKGSRYSLIVGEKVYVLETSDDATLSALEKNAGARVRLTGTEKENTLTVTSLKPVN